MLWIRYKVSQSRENYIFPALQLCAFCVSLYPFSFHRTSVSELHFFLAKRTLSARQGLVIFFFLAINWLTCFRTNTFLTCAFTTILQPHLTAICTEGGSVLKRNCALESSYYYSSVLAPGFEGLVHCLAGWSQGADGSQGGDEAV